MSEFKHRRRLPSIFNKEERQGGSIFIRLPKYLVPPLSLKLERKLLVNRKKRGKRRCCCSHSHHPCLLFLLANKEDRFSFFSLFWLHNGRKGSAPKLQVWALNASGWTMALGSVCLVERSSTASSGPFSALGREKKAHCPSEILPRMKTPSFSFLWLPNGKQNNKPDRQLNKQAANWAELKCNRCCYS